MQSRQGVLEWVAPHRLSLVDEIQARLNNGDVRLGNLVIHALDEQVGSAETRRFTALVSAPSQDLAGEIDTFRVPLTVCRPSSAPVVQQAGQLMEDHMARVDWAYQDSVETPLVISQGVIAASELTVLSAEVVSQMQAGFVQNRGDVQAAVQRTASLISNQAGEMGLTQAAVVDGLELVRSGLQHSARQLGEQILGTKRHLETENQGHSVPMRLVAQADSRSRAAVSAQVQLPHQPALQEQNPRVLSLQGLAPMTTRPSTESAYRQPQLDNHCGVAAVNAFFQCEAITPAHAVNSVIDNWESVFDPEHRGIDSLNLPGMMNPALIQAMREGRTIAMNRADFVGPDPEAVPSGFEAMYMDTPVGQWNALFNYAPYAAVGAPRARQAIQITPEIWLTAMLGLHLDQASSMINTLLQTKGNSPAWRHMPDSVDAVILNNPRAPDRINTLEAEVEQTGKAYFPMLCMVRGHYFTIAKTPEGDWVKLGSDGTHIKGLQPSELFARRGGLAEALKRVDAIRIISEPLQPVPANRAMPRSAAPAVRTPEAASFSPAGQRTTGQTIQKAMQLANGVNEMTNGASLNGFWSPRILNAMAKGESISISKQEFMRPMHAGVDSQWGEVARSRGGLPQQWQTMVNLCSQHAKGLNWIQHPSELNAINEVTVTPAQWLRLMGEEPSN